MALKLSTYEPLVVTRSRQEVRYYTIGLMWKIIFTYLTRPSETAFEGLYANYAEMVSAKNAIRVQK